MEEVKRALVRMARQNVDEYFPMVDSIQRLGIEYHFEEEIAAALQRKHDLMLKTRSYQGNDYQELSKVALQFRLMRQQGYYIDVG